MMDEKLQSQIFDLGIEENLVFDNNFFSLWEQLASWQIEILKKTGLKPEHKLLDIGCGPLRFGSEAIQYLNEDSYFGIDPFKPYIRVGSRITKLLGIDKNYSVIESVNFEFDKFGAKFDFSVAQSVLTHLSRSQIKLCLANLKKVMRKGGTFLFTFIISKGNKGRLYGGTLPMNMGKIPSQSYLHELAISFGLTYECLVENHPTGQQVGIFRF